LVLGTTVSGGSSSFWEFFRGASEYVTLPLLFTYLYSSDCAEQETLNRAISKILLIFIESPFKSVKAD